MAIVSQVYDTAQESIVEIDRMFKVVHLMPQAVAILKLFFPEHRDTARLPLILENWLKSEISVQHGTNGNSGPRPVTSSFVRCSRKLIVVAFIDSKMGAMTISLKEDPVTYSAYRNFVDQLTRRQKEVFHLMADGLRDIHEIASHLGISHRTAEEHRRVICRKSKQREIPFLY